MTTSITPVVAHPIPTTRILLIAAGLPLLVVAVALGIAIAWLPEVPQRIAVHWSMNGVDGFADRSTLPVVLGIIGFGLPLLLTGILLLNLRRLFGIVQKVLAAASVGVGVMMAAVLLASVGLQRGIVHAAEAPDIAPWVLAGAAIGIASGVGAWFVLPRASRTRADGSSGEPQPAAPLELAPGERAVWLGTARFAPWAISVQILLVVVVTGVIVLACLKLGGGAAWLLLLLPVAILVLMLGSIEWKVRADAAGLHVRGLLTWPRWDVAASEITAAGTVDVAPIADFGGWGLRWWGSRVGIVTRGGQALEVNRRDGHSLTITLDDAAAAAEVLTAAIPARR